MRNRVLVLCLVVIASHAVFAQKVKTGYKKGTNFAQYKTYTWAAADMPAQRPLVAQIVRGTIDQQLQKRGLSRVDSGGDLILVVGGSLDYQNNMAITYSYLPLPGYGDLVFDPYMWVGGTIAWSVSGTTFQHGTLILQFVDPKTKEVEWIGNVKQSLNLDLDSKEKSMKLIEKAITKLVKEYPPKP